MDSRAILTALQWEEPRLMVSSQGSPALRRRVLVVDDESAIRETWPPFSNNMSSPSTRSRMVPARWHSYRASLSMRF